MSSEAETESVRRHATPAQVVTGLEAIIDAAAGVLAEESLAATLRAMAHELREIVPFTSLALYEVDRDAQVLVPVFAVGRYVAQTLAARPPIGRAVAGIVVETGEMVHLEPGDPLPRRYTLPDTPDDEPEAVVFAPLEVGDRVIGTLNVWREGDAPTFAAEEARLICRFATLAALAYENARQRDQLREQALTDVLTGIGNRRHFDERLAAELARSVRDRSPLSLVVFDLDDFKGVNDRFGHPVGDAVLRGFASVLRRHSRASDVVCRIGGEEFAAIIPDAAGPAARGYAERVLDRTREAGLLRGRALTASAGVATAPVDGECGEALLRAADDRLLDAKRRGKDRVEAAGGQP